MLAAFVDALRLGEPDRFPSQRHGAASPRTAIVFAAERARATAHRRRAVRASVEQVQRVVAAGDGQQIAVGIGEVGPPQPLGRFGVAGCDQLDELTVRRGAAGERRARAVLVGEAAQLGHVDDLAEHGVQQGDRAVVARRRRRGRGTR